MKSTGQYSININPSDKVIEMLVVGTFLPEMADAFHQYYLNDISPMSTTDFILKIDCLHMDVISKDMLPKLQISLALCNKSNFKEIQIFIKDNPEIKKQLKRVILFSGLENSTIIVQ